MEHDKSRADWLKAARLALLRGGPEAVRVEPLARDLGVTKGSFYWHFTDRGELLEALLVEWEEETAILTDALKQADPREALPSIMAELDRRNVASERGESPSDAAIFGWAASDPAVARRANHAEADRMRLFRRLTGKKELADLFYYAYHGFLLRRRRVPGAARDFEGIARLALRTFGPKQRKRRAKSRRRLAVAAGALALSVVMQGCTTWRIVRHRDPSAQAPLKIFPQRVVRHADEPFQFTAGRERRDLDTITVRDVDITGKSFAEYMRVRKIKAFLVVRNDTIVYERYRDGFTDSTRSSSFSVAKSFTSALLGRALASGAVRNLSDRVAGYVPELSKKPAFSAMTIADVLSMKSGFAYTRTTGSLWHDFRSSDAHFYYTTDLRGSIASQKPDTAPGSLWQYKDSDTQLIGWVLTNATKQTLAAQLEEGIWRRIGTEHDASWDLDHDGGLENAASGLNATARDFARFGRLYLHGGAWNGQQIIPRDWVMASTTLDSSRKEPEVDTWWLMQHRNLWWIPMHNWSAEQDFFADGSRGQRIYVNRRLNTIIVQLADESAQDFPFRKVAHYLAGERYAYPRVIANQLNAIIANGAGPDSVRSFHRSLVARQKADSSSISYSRTSMLSLVRRLESQHQPNMAAVVRSLVPPQ